MKRITEIRVALMERVEDFNIDDNGKGNYILRSSGKFLPEEYIQKAELEKDGTLPYDEYLLYIQEIIIIIFNNLLEKTDETTIDSVGLWLVLEDGDEVENSINLSILSNMKEMNSEIIPIVEFINITLQSYPDKFGKE